MLGLGGLPLKVSVTVPLNLRPKQPSLQIGQTPMEPHRSAEAVNLTLALAPPAQRLEMTDNGEVMFASGRLP